MSESEIQCGICKKCFSLNDVTPSRFVRPSVADLIKEDHPEWSNDSFVCQDDLNIYRSKYIQNALMASKGQLTALEKEVIENVCAQDILTENINDKIDEGETLGDRMADRVASFGGSWTFILCFGLVLVTWIILNSISLFQKPFDPFPFILLNLVLSCIAAIQAPIIMMSQNRQEAKDRLRAENDYRINLKAELEIRHLHSKMDFLLTHQWQQLLEIQQVQTDLLQELERRKG